MAKKKPIVQQNTDGTTKAPGHEYAGSTIAAEILEGTSLPKEAVDYIAKGIRLHGIFNDIFQQNTSASPKELLEIIKQKSEDMHFEMVFNALCDNYTAPPFQSAIPIIIEIFNMPETYSTREYFIK